MKLALTVGWIVLITAAGRVLRWAALRAAPKQTAFWVRQAISVAGALALVGGVISIWFNDPRQLATAVGLVTAGVAFTLQRVITAVAGYLVILRGSTFHVGDRIVMGGVRGDVINVDFMQTTILEMGQTHAEQGDKPAMWVESRQYTGRVVTVSNAKIFDEPVYNYTRDLPFIWEEMRLPVPYGSDYRKAETILVEAARRHTADARDLSEDKIEALRKRYDVERLGTEPRVYLHLTDNWIELTVRFVTGDHGTRERKDAMSREVLAKMNESGLEVASGTYAVVQMPKLKVSLESPAGA